MSIFQKSKANILLPLHITVWLLVVLLPLIKSFILGYKFNIKHEINELFVSFIIFYTTLGLLKVVKSKLFFTICILLLYLGMAYVHFYIHNFIFGSKHFLPFYRYSFGYFSYYLLLSMVAYIVYIFKQKLKKDKQLHDTETALHNAEMAHLKTQLEPHFLFNTLNMIYASALKKDGNTPDLILMLSASMRYLFRKGQQQVVNIEDEIIHLRNYVLLQKERLVNKAVVTFEYDIDNQEQTLPPLLFMPLIENVFKFTSRLEANHHPVNISIILKEDKLTFKCTNPIIQNSHTEKQNGIGIVNTRRRLEYHYPGKHEFHINNTNVFEVKIEIQL